MIGQIKDGEGAMRQRNIEFLQAQVSSIPCMNAGSSIVPDHSRIHLHSCVILVLLFQLEKMKADVHKNEELQGFLANAIKGVLTHDSGVTGAEFKLFLDMLRSLPIFRKDQNLAKEVAQIITNTSGIKKEFEVRHCSRTPQP